VLEEEKCRVTTYQDAVKSLKELQEFAVQRNDSDMLGVISEAKVSVESQAAKRLKLRAENPASLLERIKKKREL
jgi:sporulation protein YlmC with PRC-barrel domain